MRDTETESLRATTDSHIKLYTGAFLLHRTQDELIVVTLIMAGERDILYLSYSSNPVRNLCKMLQKVLYSSVVVYF
jgi:hypothetical protein